MHYTQARRRGHLRVEESLASVEHRAQGRGSWRNIGGRECLGTWRTGFPEWDSGRRWAQSDVPDPAGGLKGGRVAHTKGHALHRLGGAGSIPVCQDRGFERGPVPGAEILSQLLRRPGLGSCESVIQRAQEPLKERREALDCRCMRGSWGWRQGERSRGGCHGRRATGRP